MGGDPSGYADGTNTAWWLTGYSPATDELVVTHDVSREQFLVLRELFDYGDDHWFTDSHLVTAELWPRVEAVLGAGPQDGIEYHLEGYATDY